MARFVPRQVVTGAMATLPAPDQEMLARQEFQDRFIAMIRDALRAGPRGAKLDIAHDWLVGFPSPECPLSGLPLAWRNGSECADCHGTL